MTVAWYTDSGQNSFGMPTSPIVTHSAARDPIFGPERELAGSMSWSTDSPNAALMVRGEAGIGKSALLAVASRRAEAAGMQVLRTTGVQSEAQLPFAGAAPARAVSARSCRPALNHHAALTPARTWPQRGAGSSSCWIGRKPKRRWRAS